MKIKAFVLSAVLAASAFASLPAAAAVQMVPWASGGNALVSPLTSYPALSSADVACARDRGMQRATTNSERHTPLTLGVACGLTAARLANDAYLGRLFVEYVDSHRFTAYCPSWYQVTYEGAVPNPDSCKF